MRALLQRVARAEVRVAGAVVGRIDAGLMILLGVGRDDDEGTTDALADKVRKLRIFADEDGKMNRSLADVGGAALVVSQFTLFADASSGNRPSFIGAARPDLAVPLYERFCARLADAGVAVERGEFGAAMEVELVNDGPVTIHLDSEAL